MCYSKESSLAFFIIGIITSFSLIQLGDNDFKNYNYTLGIFFIFISLVQLMEYFMWSDVNCNNNLNKIATSIGPLLIYLQPILIFILSNVFITNITNNSSLIIILNILYLTYVLYHYYNFMGENDLCTKVNEKGNLNWEWKENFQYMFYFFMIILNIIYFFGIEIGGIILLI